LFPVVGRLLFGLLFSLRRLFLLHRVGLSCADFTKNSKHSTNSPPLAVAPPSAAAPVFSLIFTSSAAAPIASQHIALSDALFRSAGRHERAFARLYHGEYNLQLHS
jgi:hypothetical protein